MEKRAKKSASGMIVHKQSIWQKMWRQRTLILMAALPMAILIIFKYVPMYGILIAFKNYKPKKGILGSDWCDPMFKNFIKFFKNVNSRYTYGIHFE